MILKALSKWKRDRKLKRAERAIEPKVFQTIQSIHDRYSSLNLNGADWPADENQKLSRLILMVNQDEQMTRLDNEDRFTFGYELVVGEKTVMGGFGVDLYFDSQNGLTVYDWNDYAPKSVRIPASPDAIGRFNPRFNAE
jgi:hypothetical protein